MKCSIALLALVKALPQGISPTRPKTSPTAPERAVEILERLREAALPDPVDDGQKPCRKAVGRAQQKTVVGPARRPQPPCIVPFGAPHEEHATRIDTGQGDAVSAARILEEDEIRVFCDKPREGFRRRLISR